MKFKSEVVAAEFIQTSVFLQHMAFALDDFSKKEFGQEIIITRVKEPICGDSGVHEANRAFDVRNEFEGGRLYDDAQIKKIVQFMNSRYPRNDHKPTCIHHSFQGGPNHIHVQLALMVSVYEPFAIHLKIV